MHGVNKTMTEKERVKKRKIINRENGGSQSKVNLMKNNGWGLIDDST